MSIKIEDGFLRENKERLDGPLETIIAHDFFSPVGSCYPSIVVGFNGAREIATDMACDKLLSMAEKKGCDYVHITKSKSYNLLLYVVVNLSAELYKEKS